MDPIEQAIRAYLPAVMHLSLGTSSAGQPWVCEVHFAYDDELNLYFRSLPSRRHSREIAADPRVAGNIVRQHGLGEAPAGVYFEGTARLLTVHSGQLQARECIRERLHVPDEALDQYRQTDGHQFYKISVSTFYYFGALGNGPVMKHALQWAGKGDQAAP